jgi:cellulose synthase operon protein C
MRLNHATALVTITLLTGGPALAGAPMPQTALASRSAPDAPLPAPAAPMPMPSAPTAGTAAQSGAPFPASSGNPFADDGKGSGGAAAFPNAFMLPPPPPGAPSGTGAAPAADERALRYYAAQRQLGRVAAEIERLKSIYPSWQPPADMFAPNRVSVDEQPFWDLFARGDYAEVRRQIAARQGQTPTWQPSDELTRKLTQAETRAKLMNAGRFGRWNEVVATATGSKDLLVCANMDVLWTLGEALARTQKLAESFDVYRYAVVNCANEGERLATVQKAGLLLPPKGQDALIALASAASASPAPYEALRFDPLRRRMGAAASGAGKTEVTDEELQGFARYIETEGTPDDAQLMGWYLYATGSFEAAAAWFNAGMQQGSDPKLTEGYVLSLRRLGRNAEAQEVAYKNRLRSAEIRKSYFEIVSEQLTMKPAGKDDDDDASMVIGTDVGADENAAPEVQPFELSKSDLTRFARFALEQKSALGSQAMGWHALKGGELAIAQDWFDKSVEWEPTEGGVIGAAVVAARLKQYQRLRAIKAAYEKQYPELAKFRTVYRQTASQRRYYRKR